MATKEQIKKAILKAAGDPETGAIKDLADTFADAVFALDNETPTRADTKDDVSGEKVQDATHYERPTKENRVTKPTETR
tara:strand:- start:3451 stop:3687 length:237 start_codon:yes stop_codon:yes gene_type:complete